MQVSGSGAPRLSVVGLGKLGSPMAAVFAAKGFDVIGVDVNATFVEALNDGRAPVEEPQLQDLITASRARLRATGCFDEAIAGSDISFIIVPTPSGADYRFSNEYVIDAVVRIGTALRHKRGDHLVVVTSTVMPGATGGVIKDALEKSSGRIVGRTVGLCYSPEFIALGSVVRDLLRPDMILIGECDETYGQRLADVYRQSTESRPSVQRMSLVSAEICKIAVNTYVTTKISYANMLAELCERLDGADVDAITTALGADSRIGPKYLTGGVAYGGPCFPRDNKAFAALARSLGVPCDIADATDRINDHQAERLLGALSTVVAPPARVAVLGLAYKLHTPVFEQSQGLALARLLLAEGYRVTLADPLAATGAQKALDGSVQVTCDFHEAVADADAAVVTTPWPAIAQIPPQAFLRPSGPPLAVVDPWGLLRHTPLASVARLILPGRRGAPESESAFVAVPVNPLRT